MHAARPARLRGRWGHRREEGEGWDRVCESFVRAEPRSLSEPAMGSERVRAGAVKIRSRSALAGSPRASGRSSGEHADDICGAVVRCRCGVRGRQKYYIYKTLLRATSSLSLTAHTSTHKYTRARRIPSMSTRGISRPVRVPSPHASNVCSATYISSSKYTNIRQQACGWCVLPWEHSHSRP